jgi:hypothetical protein
LFQQLLNEKVTNADQLDVFGLDPSPVFKLKLIPTSSNAAKLSAEIFVSLRALLR